MSTSSRESSPDEQVELPTQLSCLSRYIDQKPESFGRGDKDIRLAALQAAKYVFDMALKSEAKSRSHINELLSSLSPSSAPQTRSQAAASKNGENGTQVDAPTIMTLEETPIPELCVQGMDEEQLWAQLELRAKHVCDVLESALESTGEVDESASESALNSLADEEMDVDDLAELEELLMAGVDDQEEEGDEEGGGEEEDDDEEEDLGEDIAELRDPSDDEDEDGDIDLDQSSSGGMRPTRWKPGSRRNSELDDGFFDLAAFNAETEEAESKNVSKGRLAGDDEDSDEDMEDDVDYFAQVDEGVDGELDGTQEIFYKDFFEPPARVPLKKPKKAKTPGQKADSPKQRKSKVRFHEEVRVKRIRAQGKNLPLSTMLTEEEEDEDDDGDYDDAMAEADGSGSSDVSSDNDSDDSDEEEGLEGEFQGSGSSEDEDDMDDVEVEEDEEVEPQDTIERLKDDLFADDDEEPDQDMSTHEKRMATLQEEIVALEAENVAQKHWTLMGEATSRSRPQNALLEEDLEFDRVMKSIPVITEDVVQGLEERIKARILEDRFDDVIRKRPLDDKPFLPSRFFELQDTKSKQSLAEIYADEYSAAQTGGVVGEDRDGKLRKEHEEIEKLWENICGKLDALSNAHFTPKAPKATISTVSDVAATTLESALPTTKSTSAMLAPEEVFAPSTSDLRARSELTPIQKRALRNKEKKARRKARDTLEKGVDKFSKLKGIGGVKKQKEAALKSIVKTGKGITVVGKKSKDIIASGKKKAKS